MVSLRPSTTAGSRRPSQRSPVSRPISVRRDTACTAKRRSRAGRTVTGPTGRPTASPCSARHRARRRTAQSMASTSGSTTRSCTRATRATSWSGMWRASVWPQERGAVPNPDATVSQSIGRFRHKKQSNSIGKECFVIQLAPTVNWDCLKHN